MPASKKALLAALLLALPPLQGWCEQLPLEVSEEVRALTEKLKDKDKDIRDSAAIALGAIGPDAKAAIPALIEHLKEDSDNWKYYALVSIGDEALPDLIEAWSNTPPNQEDQKQGLGETLRGFGPRASSVIPTLIAVLKKKDGAAGSLLASIGAASVPALTDLLKEEDPVVLCIAVEALAEIGLPANPSVPALAKSLAHPAPSVRKAAALALGALGPLTKEALQELFKRAGDQEKTVREKAVETLGKVGLQAPDAAPFLIQALGDEDVRVRLAALEALAEFGPVAGKAVPALMEALQDTRHPTSFREVRQGAIKALGQMGSAAKRAIPDLIQLTKDPGMNGAVAAESCLALGDLCATEALPALTEAFNHPRVVGSAVYALGKMGPLARSAVPKLVELLQGKKSIERAADALGLIGPEARDAIPALAEALGGKWENDRIAAARALWRIGRESRPAEPALLKAMHEYNGNDASTLRAFSALALGRMGLASSSPALNKALKDSSERVRWSAAFALDQLIGQAPLPALVKALKECKEAWVRIRCVELLGELGVEAKVTIPVLVLALKDESYWVRKDAAALLGRFGPEAKESVTTLRELLSDRDSFIRRAAAKALFQVEGNP